MNPERWRAVNAVLHGALSCEPAHRDAFVEQACAGDEELRRELASLLAAHDRGDDKFLERPALERLDAHRDPSPLAERLAKALAGRYEIEREVGRGGTATVHLARDLRHDRRVAIKVLREEVAAAVGAERFLEEIRLTASMQHPHILPLFDSGSGDGLLWYVMPFVEGETLRARLQREGRLPVDAAVKLAREMADALEYAHGRGVVHRDVKPENVLLQSEGEHALVADFGIALALEKAGGERLTRTGIMLGTPQYMAPEQASGEGTADARTDVYALGAVLHEMLAGESPFAAASRQAVLQRVLHVAPIALGTRRAEVSSSIDAAVRRALAKRPDDRFASVAAFAAALAAPPLAAPRLRAALAGRNVSARAAFYSAGLMLVFGLAGGWALARSPGAETVSDASAAASTPTKTDEAWGAAKGDPWAPVKGDGVGVTIVDRAGRPQDKIEATHGWTPRFSPDGRLVAYGAFGPGRSTSDIWIRDLLAGTTRRITDDDGDSNDPQWSPDSKRVAYSVSARGGKDLASRPINGGDARALPTREGTQFPSDWLRDGSALLVTDAGGNGLDILVQPTDGSSPWPYAATRANESAARMSPDGRWVAYTSDESGRAEVYIGSYPRRVQRVRVSWNGGAHAVWRGDGKELYYWNNEELVAVKLDAPAADSPPKVGEQSVLFRASYNAAWNMMYDVSADGQRFVIVQQP
jgi:serine/threonine protein kinase